MFECNIWEGHRSRMELDIGSAVTPNNMILIVLERPAKWEKVTSAIVIIMKRKDEDEKVRKGWSHGRTRAYER